MKYYSALKENEILSLAAKWTELKDILLSERSQTQKEKKCLVFLLHGS
jgi:hypothetical protein